MPLHQLLPFWNLLIVMKPGREARASVMKRCPINASVIAFQEL
jgi:hypothetical protein